MLWGNPVMDRLPILEETEVHVTIKSLCAMQTQEKLQCMAEIVHLSQEQTLLT